MHPWACQSLYNSLNCGYSLIRFVEHRYGPNGHCVPMEGFVQAAIKAPVPLEWEVSDEMSEDIQDALNFAIKVSMGIYVPSF